MYTHKFSTYEYIYNTHASFCQVDEGILLMYMSSIKEKSFDPRQLKKGAKTEPTVVFFATPKCRKLQNKNVGYCNCKIQNVAGI